MILPKIYCSYSVIHVAYIVNMLLTPILNDFSPHEMLYKTLPDFNVQSREFFVSRDVFYEHVFPYQRVEDNSN